MPVVIKSKLPTVGTTIFSVIADKIDQHNPINLANGAPNFACSKELVDKTHLAMQAGHNQYAPMIGLKALREQVAHKVFALYGREYDIEKEVTITASASEALYASISALVHPGDEVIYIEPAFDSYAPVVELQGAKAIGIPLNPVDFRIDWQRVGAALNSKTRMIIINTPHNPTGQVLDHKDIEELTALVKDTDIIILSDEVYEHVVFDQREHLSMSRFPELAERSVVVGSFGKTFHVTGWRIGHCIAPQEIMSELRKVHQFLMFSADTPMQYALADYMKDADTYLHLAKFYQNKRDTLLTHLSGSNLTLYPSQGSFFVLANYSNISDEKDSDFVQRLITDHKVAAIPLSSFYRDGTDHRCIRLSFARDETTLIQGAKALSQL
ncbi:methionine aminotransferase [Marinomonas epiphytica]